MSGNSEGIRSLCAAIVASAGACVTVAYLLCAASTAPKQDMTSGWRAKVHDRERAIEEELLELEGHPWAGCYYEGGMGASDTLCIAPRSGYSYGSFHHMGGMEGDLDQGAFVFAGGVFRFLGARPGPLKEGLRLVRWGERSYLVPASKVEDFVNEVNAGSEPRYGSPGMILLREGDYMIPVTGEPELPPFWRSRLLAQPLEAGIQSVGAVRLPWPQYEISEIPIILDAGERDGVWPGMIMHLGDPHGYGTAVVESVSERTSSAVMRRSARDPMPVAGWTMSTTYSDYPKTPPEQALRYGVDRISKETFGYFGGRIQALSTGDLASAAKSGAPIEVIPVAALWMKAKTSALTEYFLTRIMPRLLAELGANAYVVTHPDAMPMNSKTVSLQALRVQLGDQPLKEADFEIDFSVDSKKDRWKLKVDWPRTRLRFELNRNKIQRSRTAYYESLVRRAAKMSDAAFDRCEKTVQRPRRLFSGRPSLLDACQRLGYPFASEDSSTAVMRFSNLTERSLAEREAQLRREDPQGYAEYERLQADLAD
jgi:hypothetical protein